MTVDITEGTLNVPGAVLHYETRGAGPLVVLHAAPMRADAFAPLAGRLASDRTVVCADPRGIGRSRVADGQAPVTPDQRADDLARLIEHLDRGPALLFGSSGGAVSALALAQIRPDLVHTVVAHEPPLGTLLPDRAAIAAATEKMISTYDAGDRSGYWQQFLAQAGIDMPTDVFELTFAGELDADQAADERFSVLQMQRATVFWKPDINRLRGLAARLVIGIGQDSAGQLCDRTSRALAEEIGVVPTMFPGDHTGFVEQAEGFGIGLRSLDNR